MCAAISKINFDLLEVMGVDDGGDDGFNDGFDDGDIGLDVGVCVISIINQYEINAPRGAFNFLDIVSENKPLSMLLPNSWNFDSRRVT